MPYVKFDAESVGRRSSKQEQHRQQPAPNTQRPGSAPHLNGTFRAAAMATRKSRQLREKRAAKGNLYHDSARAAVVAADFRVPVTRQPFHTKKQLNLHLDLSDIPKSDMGIIASSSNVQVIVENNKSVKPTKRGSETHRRRASSVTLSMDSPEAIDFREVAHDGPAELGKRTKRVKRLGKGAGGTVYLSLYLPTLKLVAVKEIVVHKQQEREMVKHELHALHENLSPIDAVDTNANKGGSRCLWNDLCHSFSSTVKPNACPYLVFFHGAYLTPARSAVSIVMEFMDMGSVQDLIDSRIPISEDILRHGAFCCLKALNHMHSQRMIHRDIKPANILLNQKGDFKIADFGLAETLSKSMSFASEFEGTVMYMAPERISGKQYSYASDIWSLGVALFTVGTGSYPFAVDDGFFGLEEAICTDPLPPMPNRFSPECRDFIKGLLRRDPNSRLTCAQALSHPFLNEYQGSSRHQNFPMMWSKLPLRRAISDNDIKKIANVIAEYSYRYPTIMPLPLSEATTLNKSHSTRVSTHQGESSTKGTFFNQIADCFSSCGSCHRTNAAAKNANRPLDAFRRLAEDCGISPDQLQALVRQMYTV